MSVFTGGSAYNMAQSIADGYIITTELTFKKFQDSDLQTFIFESDKLLREIRGNQVASDDVQGAQARQRRMQRVTQAITIANSVRSRRR
jgi:hypothetical protein